MPMTHRNPRGLRGRPAVEEVAQRPSRGLLDQRWGSSLVEEVAQRPSRGPVSGTTTSAVGRGGRAATVTRPGERCDDRLRGLVTGLTALLDQRCGGAATVTRSGERYADRLRGLATGLTALLDQRSRSDRHGPSDGRGPGARIAAAGRGGRAATVTRPGERTAGRSRGLVTGLTALLDQAVGARPVGLVDGRSRQGLVGPEALLDQRGARWSRKARSACHEAR